MNFNNPLPQGETASVFKISYTEQNIHEQLSSQLQQVFAKARPSQDIVIVCVGTDRSTGDALGPIVGTNLIGMQLPGLHVYGNLDAPVHAVNLVETMLLIQSSHRRPFIIAVDACLGQITSVGCIQVISGPLKPGAGVNKDLPPVGDYHVTGIVNVGGFMEYFVLQNTRLSLVMNMANRISDALHSSFSHWNHSALIRF